MNNVDKICNKNLWENGVKENQLECCKKRLKKLLQKNPPNLVQHFKRSLKYTSKSTWTTHNKRTQQILVEAFEANQERDLKQKLGICWNFWQIREQIYYLCSWSGCSLVHIIWIEIEQHKWRLLKWLLKLSLKCEIQQTNTVPLQNLDSLFYLRLETPLNTGLRLYFTRNTK